MGINEDFVALRREEEKKEEDRARAEAEKKARIVELKELQALGQEYGTIDEDGNRLTLEDITNRIDGLTADNVLDTVNFNLIFSLDDDIERQQAIVIHRAKAKEFKKAVAHDKLVKAYITKEKETEKEQKLMERQKKKEHLVQMRQDFPIWIKEGTINEVIFCKEYQKRTGIRCINGQFYTINGFISEDKIKSSIQKMISPFIDEKLSQKTEALFKALKNASYYEMPPPSKDEIHLQNGILKVDGSFIEEKAFCLNRLNVSYAENYTPPATWLAFLKDLLSDEDILTLQEFLGYCLIPTTRAQVMLMLIGQGGEGKSQIGTILKAIFGQSAESGSLPDLENNKYAMVTIENKLLFIDDDLSTDGLKDTKNIKRIVTADGKLQVEGKFQPIREAHIYCRLLAFGNFALKALYDTSEGFFRRQIVINVKPKPEDRADDKNLIDKMLPEKDMIFLWILKGLQRLVANGYHFTISEQTRQTMEEVREEACNVGAFMKDEQFVIYGENYQITSNDLIGLYDQWCCANAENPLKPRTMLNYLKNNAKKFRIVYSNNIKLSDGGKVRGFKGIRMADRAKGWGVSRF